MRAPSNLERGSLGFNMTPMIDIVFLLIIFFLVSSHLARQEVQLELDLPQAQSGHRADEDETRRVVVNVVAEDDIRVAGRRITIDKLRDVLQHERQQGEDLQVRIRSDQAVPYRAVEPIMVTCAKAGVWDVVIAVVREEH